MTHVVLGAAPFLALRKPVLGYLVVDNKTAPHLVIDPERRPWDIMAPTELPSGAVRRFDVSPTARTRRQAS